MRKRTQQLFVIVLALLTLAGTAAAEALEDAKPLSAREVQWNMHHRLDGEQYTAEVQFKVVAEARHLQAPREWNVKLDVHRDDVGNRERIHAKLTWPLFARGFAGLSIEDKEDQTRADFFLYVPYMRRVRRVSESWVGHDLQGIDLTHVGFTVSRVQPVTLEAVEQVWYGNPRRRVYKLTERAKNDTEHFEIRYIWVDPDTWIPLATENWDEGRLVLSSKTIEIQEIDGVLTPTHTRFHTPPEGEHGFTVTVDFRVIEIDYKTPVPEKWFSQGYLEQRGH